MTKVDVLSHRIIGILCFSEVRELSSLSRVSVCASNLRQDANNNFSDERRSPIGIARESVMETRCRNER